MRSSANGGGLIELMVCDSRGELRAMSHDPERSPDAEARDERSVREGYLAITFDQPQIAGRYQGIVQLGSGAWRSRAKLLCTFRTDSELVSVGGQKASDAERGLWLQHLPEGEEGRSGGYAASHPDGRRRDHRGRSSGR